ncbi:MAG: urease accessory protein [Pseudomonadota bacterium]
MGAVLLLGMKHAIEADHVAAIALLATQIRNPGEVVRLGSAWGLGHAAMLFGVGALVLSLDTVLPERVAMLLELGIGVMFVGLGADVVRRTIRNRIHFHLHRHGDGTRHLHAHSHAGQPRHDPSRHEHRHVLGVPVRAIRVGLTPGMAGSAALILLALGQIDSLWLALGYMALFGLGSMLGMPALSLAIAVPLRRLARSLTVAHGALNGALGALTVAIGGWVIYCAG